MLLIIMMGRLLTRLNTHGHLTKKGIVVCLWILKSRFNIFLTTFIDCVSDTVCAVNDHNICKHMCVCVCVFGGI